jgi:hypothetical protein
MVKRKENVMLLRKESRYKRRIAGGEESQYSPWLANRADKTDKPRPKMKPSLGKSQIRIKDEIRMFVILT